MNLADPCSSNPCQNRGNCRNNNNNFYTCECFQGYSGTNCQIQTGTNCSSNCQIQTGTNCSSNCQIQTGTNCSSICQIQTGTNCSFNCQIRTVTNCSSNCQIQTGFKVKSFTVEPKLYTIPSLTSLKTVIFHKSLMRYTQCFKVLAILRLI